MDDAWSQLELAGIEPLYSSETPEGVKEIYGNTKKDILRDPTKLELSAVQTVAESVLPEIDWAAQWASHGLDYHDGFVHVSLEKFGCPAFALGGLKELKLEPGPGFGDLSHPTTRLVLKMMAPCVPGAHILDIGCGSGVLTLAAAAMGALSAYGVDIDPDAIAHARRNAVLNGLQSCAAFGLPSEYCKQKGAAPLLVVMNMIASEQLLAWDSLKAIHNVPGDCLISGILERDLPQYLDQTRRWGWTLRNRIAEEGWLGLQFMRDLHKI